MSRWKSSEYGTPSLFEVVRNGSRDLRLAANRQGSRLNPSGLHDLSSSPSRCACDPLRRAEIEQVAVDDVEVLGLSFAHLLTRAFVPSQSCEGNGRACSSETPAAFVASRSREGRSCRPDVAISAHCSAVSMTRLPSLPERRGHSADPRSTIWIRLIGRNPDR